MSYQAVLLDQLHNPFELVTGGDEGVVTFLVGKAGDCIKKIKGKIEYRFSSNDEDMELLEISNQNVADGDFLGIEESEAYMYSILNAKT